MIQNLCFLFLVFLPFSPSIAMQADISDDLSTYFKSGDYKSIAKKFASSVEFALNNEEDVYSKVQGEQILKDFFVKNPPVKSNISHRINTNPNFRYCVILLNTNKDLFRISVTMKKINNEYLITELRMEQSKA